MSSTLGYALTCSIIKTFTRPGKLLPSFSLICSFNCFQKRFRTYCLFCRRKASDMALWEPKCWSHSHATVWRRACSTEQGCLVAVGEAELLHQAHPCFTWPLPRKIKAWPDAASSDMKMETMLISKGDAYIITILHGVVTLQHSRTESQAYFPVTENERWCTLRNSSLNTVLSGK